MRFNFKKIASAASSALMIGSTVALAAAAQYPAPFVQGSTADVAIVVGQGAATTDMTAAQSISSDLSTMFASNGGSAANDTVDLTAVENVKLYKDGDKLNLGNSVTGILGTSTLTSTDLPGLLADGTYTNDANSDYDYEQRITLGSNVMRLNFFQDSDYKDRTPSVGINLTSNQLVLNYSLDFTTDAQSTLTSGDLVDFETTTINLLGKEYYISDLNNGTGNTKITLLDAANSGIVAEGETTTITVDGQTYTVGLNFVSSSEAKLDVNGEITNSLSEGGTFKLSDGAYVGIKDILYNSKDTGVSKVEFSIGKGKIEMTNGQQLRINDDTINDLTAEIARGPQTSSKETIDRINIAWTTQNDEFITPESSLVMPELKALALAMPEFHTGTPEVTKVRAGSSDYMQIETMLKDGEATIPFLYGSTTTGNFTGLGKSTGERFVTGSSDSVLFNYTLGDRYFVATWNSSSQGESYYMKLDNFVNDNGINKTTFFKHTDSGWTESCRDRRAGDSCTIGSLTLTVTAISPYSDRAVNLTVSSGGSFNTLYTKEGLKIFLPYVTETNSTAPGVISNFSWVGGLAGHNRDSFDLTFVTEDRNDNVALGSFFNVTVNDNSNHEFEASSVAGNGRGTFTNPDDTNHVLGRTYSDVSALIERFGQSSDQRNAVVTYDAEESYGDLRISAYSATGGSSSSGGALGDIVVTADKASTVGSKNLIVVGGSCINTAAATLLGSTSPMCGADFTQSTGVGAGSFLIQSFTSPWSSSKVALLVAGYNADDTINAANALKSQKPDTMVGKKFTGSTGTSLTPITT